MTEKQAAVAFNKMMDNVFTMQWEKAREVGLTDEEIAALWVRPALLPGSDWRPPAPKG